MIININIIVKHKTCTCYFVLKFVQNFKCDNFENGANTIHTTTNENARNRFPF